MLRRQIIVFLLFTLLASALRGQDGGIMNVLLNRIEALQARESSVFPKGSFPSYRMYALNKDREKADINPFFTGLVAMSLQDLRLKLLPQQQEQVNRIIKNSIPVFSKFQNRKGRPTYNFWPTDTPKIFPNAGWLNIFDKQQALPDDLDDTVIMLLALNAPDSIAKQVHALMQQFTNKDGKKVHNTFKGYRNIGAYSTWFGKKMAIDFDACVLSNVLYFVQRYQLSWTRADSASLNYLERIIIDNRYLTNASYVAPQYARPSVLLYHLSRLMLVKPIPSLEKLKPKLIEDAKRLLIQSSDFMDQCILHTSLLRWGVKPENTVIWNKLTLQALIENSNFSFFVANMASMLPNPWKVMLGNKLGKFYYFCEAYNNLLVLENIILNESYITGN